MPYLVAGFVAYKAAQAAANALAILAVPMKIAETAATIAHTRALKANSAAVVTNRGATAASAAATATNTAATNAGVIANTRARVATIAKTAAEKAAAVASKAWAAAQWLLNAAMSANPLMLVVIGIGLLIGAAVLAYKKIAWFRVGVDVAFKAIGAGVGWVVGFVKRNWPLLLTIILGPLGLIVALVIRNFDRIKSFVSGAIEGTKNAVGRGLQFMKTAFFRFSPVGLVISQWSRMKAAAASGASLARRPDHVTPGAHRRRRGQVRRRRASTRRGSDARPPQPSASPPPGSPVTSGRASRTSSTAASTR
ncbi:hypothetical protein G5V59_27000 [Nocardioides sp. W3-2-3]|uniref:hypothetical protein n=1 Tax=Nocardioides convexus TaxID=2712224 RepID=UPI0024187A47|nr:hypothetical protein [Nocardioides convexus]NHA02041.1 hypothetical protein [Nocardioides convexus]